jgi:hypothetical protein
MATALEYWFGPLAPHVVVEREKGWAATTRALFFLSRTGAAING